MNIAKKLKTHCTKWSEMEEGVAVARWTEERLERKKKMGGGGGEVSAQVYFAINL